MTKEDKSIHWLGVSGSWRKTTPELEQDLRREVVSALDEGWGIVTGGALNVDYSATELALERYPDGSRIKVILPTSLEAYAEHYRKRAEEGVITTEQAETLIKQLELVNSLGSLVTNPEHSIVDKEAYYLRNSEVVKESDRLLALQVNGSGGTQDTIDKAHTKGVPVQVHSYTVE